MPNRYSLVITFLFTSLLFVAGSSERDNFEQDPRGKYNPEVEAPLELSKYGLTLYNTNYLPPDAVYIECVRQVSSYFYGVFYRFTDGVLYQMLEEAAILTDTKKTDFKLLINLGTMTDEELNWITSLISRGSHVQVKLWKSQPYLNTYEKLHPKFTLCNDNFAAVGSANWSNEERSNNMEIMAKVSNTTLVAELKEKFFVLWNDPDHAIPFA